MQLREGFREYMMDSVYGDLCEGYLEAPWWLDAYDSHEAVIAHDIGLAMEQVIAALQKGEQTWECLTTGWEQVPWDVRTFWEEACGKGVNHEEHRKGANYLYQRF